MDLKDNMYCIPARRQPKQKRVAIYARVSSNTKDQLRSLANQVSALTQKVSLVEDWRLADIYIDVASAKAKSKREEYNRLIDDCRNKKVTIVLTKSVSRFGRDTIEALETVRLLKELKVRIIFEKENINTLDAKGEVLLTIMASLAQQESQSLSQNVKLGLQYRYQQGKVQVNHKRFMGYSKDEDGNLIIVPEEAEIINRIYREYLEGQSLVGIGRVLKMMVF